MLRPCGIFHVLPGCFPNHVIGKKTSDPEHPHKGDDPFCDIHQTLGFTMMTFIVNALKLGTRLLICPLCNGRSKPIERSWSLFSPSSAEHVVYHAILRAETELLEKQMRAAGRGRIKRPCHHSVDRSASPGVNKTGKGLSFYDFAMDNAIESGSRICLEREMMTDIGFDVVLHKPFRE
jgi:hypothetical protein